MRVSYETETVATFADAIGLALRFDPLGCEAGKGSVEVFDSNGDVPVADANLVRSSVMV